MKLIFVGLYVSLCRRLSHETWKWVERFDMGAYPRKQRTAQSKKVTKLLHFTAQSDLIYAAVAVPDIITCARFWTEILYRGSNFSFSCVF